MSFFPVEAWKLEVGLHYIVEVIGTNDRIWERDEMERFADGLSSSEPAAVAVEVRQLLLSPAMILAVEYE